jgi:hypothetical protein
VWDDFSLIVNNATLRDPSLLGELLTTGFWNISSSKRGPTEALTRTRIPDPERWHWPLSLTLNAGTGRWH